MAQASLAHRQLRIPKSCARPCAVRRRLDVCCSVRARWCIDVRYGHKMDATALMQEWIREIGRHAGLNGSNTRLSSGSIGVPESRLEMEVMFESTADWEQFLSRIPSREHKAWSQRIQSMVVDGSPKWEVYRSVDVGLQPDQPSSTATTSGAAASTAVTSTTTPGGLMLPSFTSAGAAGSADAFIAQMQEALRLSGGQTLGSPALAPPPAGLAPPSGPSPAPPSTSLAPPSSLDSTDGSNVVLDWKGDPMTINPGDKLPFKFL